MNDAGVTPKDLVQQWAFAVEIDGFNAAYFTKADVPKAEFDEVTFSPGGSLFDQKAPGRMKFADITMEKGIAADGADTDAYSWLSTQADTVNATAALMSDFMKDIAIIEYDRAGSELRRWNIHGAWIKIYDPGSREGKTSDNAMETLTIAYQYYTLE